MNKLLLCIILVLSAQSCMLAKKHKHYDKQDCKTDCGPNRNQAAPCLKSAKKRGCEVVVNGSLSSAADTDFIIQVYSDDASVLLGEGTVHTDGDASFVITVPCNCVDKQSCFAVKATATRLRSGGLTDTSEFSKPIQVSF